MHGLALALLTLILLLSPRLNAATLLYSGNIDSELEPCGCSVEGDLGGLRRHATVLAQERQKQPELVALSSGGLTKVDHGFSPIKHQFLRQGKALLHYDAIGLQWPDLAEGLKPALSEPLPWVASNWRGQEFAHSRILVRRDFQLEYFQWLDPMTSPYRGMKAATAPIDEAAVQLERQLKAAYQAGRVVVLGTTLSLDEARAQLPLRWVDILLIESAYEKFSEPQNVDQTLVLQPGSRGMRLGVLDFTVQQGRIAAWSHRVVAMPNTMANADSMESWYSAYNVAVKADYKEKIARIKAKHQQTSAYAGQSACATCHAEIVSKLENSKHSHAFATLEKAAKDFDPECIACHTVGWGQEGGFVDVDSTAQLKNVQCENCHGPRAQHALTGVKVEAGKPNPKTCMQCHNLSHSPSFDFDSYWPKIKH